MKKLTILLVENHWKIRDALENQLMRIGYQVVPVDSWERCMQELWRQYFDAVVINFNLLGMNGLELATLIKEKSPDTRIVRLGAEKFNSPSPNIDLCLTTETSEVELKLEEYLHDLHWKTKKRRPS